MSYSIYFCLAFCKVFCLGTPINGLTKYHRPVNLLKSSQKWPARKIKLNLAQTLNPAAIYIMYHELHQLESTLTKWIFQFCGGLIYRKQICFSRVITCVHYMNAYDPKHVHTSFRPEVVFWYRLHNTLCHFLSTIPNFLIRIIHDLFIDWSTHCETYATNCLQYLWLDMAWAFVPLKSVISIGKLQHQSARGCF